MAGKPGRSGAKPGERRGGRQKGTPNKITTSVREMVLEALDRAGGVKWLIEQAHNNPNAFATLLGKCIPAQVEATVEQHTTITVQERRQKALELIEAAFGNTGRGSVSGHATAEDGASRLH